MTMAALSWAMDCPIADPLAKLLLIRMANDSDQDDFCEVSMEEMVRFTIASEEEIAAALNRLVSYGLIVWNVHPRRSGMWWLDVRDLRDDEYAQQLINVSFDAVKEVR